MEKEWRKKISDWKRNKIMSLKIKKINKVIENERIKQRKNECGCLKEKDINLFLKKGKNWLKTKIMLNIRSWQKFVPDLYY